MNNKPQLLALSTLLLCACATRVVITQKNVSTAVPVTSSAPLVNSGQDAVVDRKLAAIDEFSVQARDRPAEIPSQVRGVQLLDAPAAVQAVLAVKARVLDEFHDPRFVIVYEKLNDAFTTTIGESHLEYKTTPSGQSAVTSTSLYEVLKEIADLVKNVTNQADVRATFMVHTDPSGATFDLCPQYLTEGCIHVTTDATIASIFRGLYTYRVSLAGYLPVAYPLDLVHFSQTRLDCRLRATTASPCTPH